MSNIVSAGILGGGITGLSAAYTLTQKGIDVTLYESSERVGGLIQSYREGDWLVEAGPNTLMARTREIWKLIHELKLEDRVIESNSESRNRFVVKDKKLCPIPMSVGQFLTTDLISVRAKLRLLKEPFIPPAPPDRQESIADFIRRRLGPEPFNYAIDPFISGIYAGDPERLSVRHTFTKLFKLEQAYGSLFKGAFKSTKKSQDVKKSLISFDEGLQVLPNRLAEMLGNHVKLNSRVKDLSPSNDGWEIFVDEQGTQAKYQHDVIISTLPSYQLSRFKGLRASGISKLSDIHYAPIAVLALGFEHSQIGHPLDGFGMLIPNKESYRVLGTLFSSSLFPNRAAENHVLLTSFIGGDRHPGQARKSLDQLVEQTLADLNDLLDLKGNPIFKRHFFWENAIPQYRLGYERFCEAIDQAESQHSGFFISGNFRKGVSVPDCISQGIETAARASMFLSS